MSAVTRADLHTQIEELPEAELATAGQVLTALQLLPASPGGSAQGQHRWAHAVRAGHLVPGSHFFSQHLVLGNVSEQHDEKRITDPDALRADFWPEDESVDDVIDTVRAWRRAGGRA